MRILVDELPASPKECRHNELKMDPKKPCNDCYIDSCELTSDRSFECKVGSEGFVCPFYRKFIARTEEPIGDPRGHLMRIAPVVLKGD